MAIQLTKNTKQILIKGTEIELNSVYVRIAFTCNYDATISVTFKTFLSHNSFTENNEIYTDVSNIPFEFAILNTETQSLDVALEYMKNKFIELGYNATII